MHLKMQEELTQCSVLWVAMRIISSAARIHLTLIKIMTTLPRQVESVCSVDPPHFPCKMQIATISYNKQ